MRCDWALVSVPLHKSAGPSESKDESSFEIFCALSVENAATPCQGDLDIFILSIDIILISLCTKFESFAFYEATNSWLHNFYINSQLLKTLFYGPFAYWKACEKSEESKWT